jgi:hypothetical protein
MIYYGQPGPFADSVERSILDAARATLSPFISARPAGDTDEVEP